ncbi:hypothetical protein [Amycolatopsis taiwanensis]|uniref:PIN domain-containing protein n=1 Tax=Amycolatopsis taiwanensis TaxID=342230 RepID=A0A9W6R7H4_9PSEU|nr:hypothetical protein [Amycolatopsis taiwanensis]GLY70804.1 hypothetical protein Atai01_74230 [Amycolatopsis taiwanensis]
MAEIGYLLGVKASARTEAFLLRALSDRDFLPVELTSADYTRMAELVERYHDLPLGTSEASVIALAERLDVACLNSGNACVDPVAQAVAYRNPDMLTAVPVFPSERFASGRVR